MQISTRNLTDDDFVLIFKVLKLVLFKSQFLG